MEEIFSQVWVWIASAVGGLSIAGILTAVIYGVLQGAFKRTISKINVEKIAELATDKGVEKVKSISFSHSIQPLIESELHKINEYAQMAVAGYLDQLNKRYDYIISILDKLSAYFDNSIGVCENAKKELKAIIAEAKEEVLKAESKVAESTTETVEEPPAEKPQEVAVTIR